MQCKRLRFFRTSTAVCSLFVSFFSARASAASSSLDSSLDSNRYSLIGPWTLSAGFPQGGSILGVPTMSVRYELMAGEFITAGLNFSSDTKAKTDSTGLFAKWNHMLSSNWARSFPYVFLQTGYLAQKTSDKSKRESSMVSALGLGVEVSVIREISTSVETGFGGTLWPSSSATFATATTQLMIHYHFQF